MNELIRSTTISVALIRPATRPASTPAHVPHTMDPVLIPTWIPTRGAVTYTADRLTSKWPAMSTSVKGAAAMRTADC